MKKIAIAAVLATAVAAYFLLIKRKAMPAPQPAKKIGNTGKHITGVFARAKEHGM